MIRRREKTTFWTITIGCFLLIFLALPRERACFAVETTEVQITEVEIGFDGKYKVGHWVPVFVTITAGSQDVEGHIEIETVDSDGVKTHFNSSQQEPLSIDADTQQTVILDVIIGRVRSSLGVHFNDQQGKRTSRVFNSRDLLRPALASQQLIVTVGRSIGTEKAFQLRDRKESEQIVSAVVDESYKLPDKWHEYQGIDTLILTTSQQIIYQQLSKEQLTAIERWVSFGGDLIVSAASQAGELLATDGPLERFSPGRFLRVEKIARTAGVETYADASKRLDLVQMPDEDTFQYNIAVLDNIEGNIEASEGAGYPVIVRRPYGFGQITFVAVDLDQLPFIQWQDLGRFVAKLLAGGGRRDDEVVVERRLRQMTHVGYEDLAGQLRSALDQFTQVKLVPFSWIAILIVVYITIIGPGDYFLLRKINRGMHWTWLTFPLAVFLFCYVAYALVGWTKGNQLQVNQVDLVDIDTDSGLIRGNTWTHLYSPKTDNFNLSLLPDESLVSYREGGILFSWWGLPGKAFGGLNTTTGSSTPTGSYKLEKESLATADSYRTKLTEMPLLISATKSFTGSWWGESKLTPSNQLRLSPEGLIEGTLQNPLPSGNVLLQCVLFYDRWAYEVGRLESGKKVNLAALDKPRTVDYLLTQRTVVEMKGRANPWNRASVDVPRIMQMVMFHEAAGGQAYTSLLHRYQGYLDLSRHLNATRAVLVGRTSKQASLLARDGRPLKEKYDRNWTFYRFVIPVKSAEKILSRTDENPPRF